MLNIYYGREDVDKQRFLFERILKERTTGCTYLVVPDQFTLETERAAFDYLKKDAFIDPIVLSMNRLAGKVLAETGEGKMHIDQYGKYMLLAKLLLAKSKKAELMVYGGLENAQAFIEKLSDAIMSLKAHLVTPEDLIEASQRLEDGDLLKRKLADIAGIYEDYENALEEGIPDSTDIMRLFAERIADSRFVRGRKFWFWGFDYFSPLQISAVAELAAAADEVNVVLTTEPGNPFFSLADSVVEKLEEASKKRGAKGMKESIPKDCSYQGENIKPDAIRYIESNLFKGGIAPCPDESTQTLRFVMASDAYHEAEKAATEIIRLVREENLRYRDILVLCNDVEHRSRAIARVLESHGIPVFLDSRREVDHNPVFEFILAFPEILARGRQADDILRWIDTGLTNLSDGEAEELENYAEKYRLRGSAWNKPLRRSSEDTNEEAFAGIQNAVLYVSETINAFAETFGNSKATGERTEALKTFLIERCDLPGRIETYADRLEEEGMAVQAQEMRGVWDVTRGIFDQIEAVFGDTEMSREAYVTVLKAGFASVRIGVLPAFSDSVTIGTMQRTRTGKVKAMFVLGANDGELPKFSRDEGLITDEEKDTLEVINITGFRSDDTLRAEEQLAIYKNLSKPTRLLYMSYDTKPSTIFGRLMRLFPDVHIEDDSDVSEKAENTMVSFAGKHPESIGDSIGAERMRALLTSEGDPITVSPSSLERYSRCPFAFAMDRAIKLKELRRLEIDSRGIGDVYHEALMEFGIRMSKSGAPAKEESAWHTVGRTDTDKMADEIFDKLAAGVAEEQKNTEGGRLKTAGYAALFDEGDAIAEYRRARILSIVKDVYWALTLSARDGGAESMQFETSFREGKALPPIEIPVPSSDEPVRIAGRIDRLDVLPGDRAMVIDYKSGSDQFNRRDVREGWQLQLMTYLRAAEAQYEPRGASYFRIFEPHIDVSEEGSPSTASEIDEAVLKQYREDGIMIDQNLNPEKLEAAEKEFAELRAVTDETLTKIATGIAEGTVYAKPKKKGGGQETACTYCSYLGICNLKN